MKVSVPKLERSSYFILSFLFLFFFISLMAWLAVFPGIRRTFIFNSSDSSKLRLETRYVPIHPEQGKYQFFIDELLLGPVSEHCSGIFASGTRVKRCFRRDDTLFVDFSKELLQADAFSADFEAQFALFKMNVLKNFPEIKNVEIFIDGTTPFGE